MSLRGAGVPPPVRCHITVSGRVQGMFYRKYTEKAARARELRGWVRNLSDGRVEIMAEGKAESVKSLVEWCHKGSPKSKVEAVDAIYLTDVEDGEELPDFGIKPTM